MDSRDRDHEAKLEAELEADMRCDEDAYLMEQQHNLMLDAAAPNLDDGGGDCSDDDWADSPTDADDAPRFGTSNADYPVSQYQRRGSIPVA